MQREEETEIPLAALARGGYVLELISVDYKLGVTLCPQPGPHNKSEREQQRAGAKIETGDISLTRRIIIFDGKPGARWFTKVTDAVGCTAIAAISPTNGMVPGDRNNGKRSRICLVLTVAG